MNTNKLTPSEKLKRSLHETLDQTTLFLNFVNNHSEAIDDIGKEPSIYNEYVDFDNLDRPALMKTLRLFPGKWTKTPGYNGGIHYTLAMPVDGLTVRCYNGEPPPGCVIKETVKYVDVPARTERIVTRTVECPNSNEDNL